MAKSIRDYLLAGVAKQAGVEALMAELNEAREGMYTCSVKAAIVAEDKGAFMEASEKLMADFRRNLRGIAEKFNMEQASDTHGKLKTDDDGNPIYKVPSSLSTAKSVLGKGFDNGADFGTLDNPASFGAIRDFNKLAKQASEGEASEDKAELTGDAKRRQDGRELLAEVADSLDGYSGKALTAVLKLIRALAKYQPEQAAESKAESKAA